MRFNDMTQEEMDAEHAAEEWAETAWLRVSENYGTPEREQWFG